ncbi:uncharacterized protein LAESUDRAFT_353030 [Laetiporus sulphureus 93-53]|uniref:Uncharacterized protein n=1 Tax=Laetiporus sulphureus 93-53 TaxID=1314785 RepID=A0A165GV62_9APHY|nr:uncharacterized protein LAESUDRAFT_353030 [Laetiporus sulphureus 93-53]KZT10861.1 hypothetical protein LAESUDRAFT_353030 [Laetiporus sulphureus 93-53]
MPSLPKNAAEIASSLKTRGSKKIEYQSTLHQGDSNMQKAMNYISQIADAITKQEALAWSSQFSRIKEDRPALSDQFEIAYKSWKLQHDAIIRAEEYRLKAVELAQSLEKRCTTILARPPVQTVPKKLAKGRFSGDSVAASSHHVPSPLGIRSIVNTDGVISVQTYALNRNRRSTHTSPATGSQQTSAGPVLYDSHMGGNWHGEHPNRVFTASPEPIIDTYNAILWHAGYT